MIDWSFSLLLHQYLEHRVHQLIAAYTNYFQKVISGTQTADINLQVVIIIRYDVHSLHDLSPHIKDDVFGDLM